LQVGGWKLLVGSANTTYIYFFLTIPNQLGGKNRCYL